MTPESSGGLLFDLILQTGLLIWGLLVLVGWWRLFTKLGIAGWTSLVPVYNLVVLVRALGRPGWMSMVMLIPVVNVVPWFFLSKSIVSRVHRGDGQQAMSIALWLVPPVLIPLLGLGPTGNASRTTDSVDAGVPALVPDFLQADDTSAPRVETSDMVLGGALPPLREPEPLPVPNMLERPRALQWVASHSTKGETS